MQNSKNILQISDTVCFPNCTCITLEFGNVKVIGLESGVMRDWNNSIRVVGYSFMKRNYTTLLEYKLRKSSALHLGSL